MIFCSAKLQNKLDIHIFSFLFCVDFATFGKIMSDYAYTTVLFCEVVIRLLCSA